jgi:hypothetical protein
MEGRSSYYNIDRSKWRESHWKRKTDEELDDRVAKGKGRVRKRVSVMITSVKRWCRSELYLYLRERAHRNHGNWIHDVSMNNLLLRRKLSLKFASAELSGVSSIR